MFRPSPAREPFSSLTMRGESVMQCAIRRTELDRLLGTAELTLMK